MTTFPQTLTHNTRIIYALLLEQMPLSFTRNDLGDSNFSGCEVSSVRNGDIKTALEKATSIGFDFIACSLDGDDAFYRNRRRRRMSGEASSSSCSSEDEEESDFVQRPCDFQLTAESWSSRVVTVSAFGCPGDYYEHFKGERIRNTERARICVANLRRI